MAARLLVLPGVVFVAFSILALEPKDVPAEYARMQKWQFSQPVPVPAGGITLTRDTATWTLESGTVRLMEPLAGGASTGVYFEGRGRFRMSIPDRFELAQLRRFTKKRDLAELDQPITQLLLRTSDAEKMQVFPAATSAYGPFAAATKKHEAWLVDLRVDADARILLALLNPGSLQIVAGMQTADFDWLTYEYDSMRDEEISVTSFQAILPETWISLDAPGDRQDGRPGPRRDVQAVLEHIDVTADLRKNANSSAVSRHQQRPINGKYSITQTFAGASESTGALRLGIASRAEELEAFTETGEPLFVMRDHVGKRAAGLDNRIHDDDFVVVLPSPLLRGEKQKIRFEYELETFNYAPGGIWYPMIRDALQKHTARLELTVKKRNELRAMGRMENRREGSEGETSVWIVEKPANMITFSTATRFEEVKVASDGLPEITAFGPDFQFANTVKLRNVATDVANSIFFYQKMFGADLDPRPIYVTSVAGGHGQAFDGFLHMGEFTFVAERPGASELFRAHEVAHEWWGHKVGWSSYRDQWLTEAFAEYSAMMFVQQTVKGGEGFFTDILRSYDGIVRGNMAGGFSKFNRPWLIERNAAERNRLGPIGHGRRAATRDMPFGYTVQAYHKGPLVLHMLRTLLRCRTGKDELFISVLRDFIREQDGRNASTEDFRRVLERNTNMDWGWYFDSWIYSADIPSYHWRYSVKPAGEGVELTLDLERRDVADDFRTIIPVRLDYEDGKSAMFYVMSDKPKQSVTHKLPAKPKKVEFAPDFSLLANVRRD
ncbi:MAG TPA: M1 family aminopeptidase [Thermoanaerobaculia bacterium]|nr:M1 family aminopeptidase [Thermoanaerobaculia bacterium]